MDVITLDRSGDHVFEKELWVAVDAATGEVLMVTGSANSGDPKATYLVVGDDNEGPRQVAGKVFGQQWADSRFEMTKATLLFFPKRVVLPRYHDMPANWRVEDREPITHRVKTWPQPFEAQWNGFKPFEVRRFDRKYQPGDRLESCEYDPREESFTGREVHATISYVVYPGSWGMSPTVGALGLSGMKNVDGRGAP